MDSVFVEQLKRIRYLAALLLSLNLVALALAAAGDSRVTLVVLLTALLLATALLLVTLRSRSMTSAVTKAQDPVLAIDPNTGIATESWYRHMLALECRRSVREFAPLTVMLIHPGEQVKRKQLLELVRLLGEEFSRPGDLIGWEGEHRLGAVLPSTNENVRKLVEHCFDRVRAYESMTDLPLHIVATTFQPRGDLSLDKVHVQLERMLQEALQHDSGVLFEAEESNELASPGMMYTDQ
ncbi:hypothetical protein [Marinobacterium sediminicola]|uniref:GGDEF domain-containing protein n=1 Tax=Marinobacterium sediminicola TaxID=518898 RepID=A0ABY1RWF7_9GAMM|nr:hypothetical protein [Marinobacterium sediminicola]ULG70343.1 hypothetical protein LN244_05885 [Marinobacterium sediminicola]SMR69669.1 hypothetical protein SAMN04487964_101323 [Marinobacterium sediminicola]